MGCISSTTYNAENAPQRNLKPIPRQQRKSVNEVTKLLFIYLFTEDYRKNNYSVALYGISLDKKRR